MLKDCICLQCKKPFRAYVVRGGHTGRFCKHKCYTKWRTGKAVPGPMMRPGYMIRGGYRWIRAQGPEMNPRRAGTTARKAMLRSGRYVQEHVAIAERTLGRPLKKGEVVHHINFDKLDNRNENLLVCDQAYHRWLHDRMAKAWAVEHLGASTKIMQESA